MFHLSCVFLLQLVPPVGMLNNPMNAVTTKFVRTSTNKVKCPVFVIRVRSCFTSCQLLLHFLSTTSKLCDGKIINIDINIFLCEDNLDWRRLRNFLQRVDESALDVERSSDVCLYFLFVSSGLLKVDVWSLEPRVESSRCGTDSHSTLRPFYR